jgi:hypothetical protein
MLESSLTSKLMVDDMAVGIKKSDCGFYVAEATSVANALSIQGARVIASGVGWFRIKKIHSP